MSDYSGRHRPPTRAERRAQQRRARTPKSLSPGYVLPSAAAAALVLTAGGAAAAQGVPFTADAAEQAKAAFTTVGRTSAASALLADPQVADTARTEAASVTDEAAGLEQRRHDASTTVAQGQGRAQERRRVARDEARQELAAERAADKRRAAAEKRKAAAEKREAAAERRAEGAASESDESTTESGAVGEQGWVRPLDNAVFTSGYGMRWGRLHAGQDYAAGIGTPLKAMSSGTVIAAGPMAGYGVYIDVRYWDGTVSRYGHLNSIVASVGQQVSPGDVVAMSGNSGQSTGPHLHMEIRPGGGAPIDPAGWLAERGIN